MPKLPATDHAKLKSAFASGHFPDDGTPDADYLFDFVSELSSSIAEECFDPAPRSTRRDVGVLLSIFDAIPWDGMITGVVINQGQLLPEGVAAAESMGLHETAEVLKRAVSLVPARILASDIDTRLDWTQSPEGEAVLEELDVMGDALEEWEHRGPLYEACLRRVLAEPTQFFEA